jgi:hypothetical protein
MNFLDFSNLTDGDIIAEVESLNHYFASCEEIGQGINTKDVVRMNAFKEEGARRGINPLYFLP